MQTTIFLAQLWGPVILAIGLGIFISRSYYIRLYRDLEKETLATLAFGAIALVAGIVQIGVHNVWGSLPEVIITLIGWATLIKGIILVIVPGIADKAGNWEVKMKLIPSLGAIAVIVGVYLSWVGLFS